MTKKKNEKATVRRLMNSWALRLAHQMMDEHTISLNNALNKAYGARGILERMGKGVAIFYYLKEDGSLRKARGTLHRGIDPDFDNYKGKGKAKRDNSNTEGIYTYWDLDRHAFRTFKAFNLIGDPPQPSL
jgi:hypothetical protein